MSTQTHTRPSTIPTSHAPRLQSCGATVSERLAVLKNLLDPDLAPKEAAAKATAVAPDPRYVAGNQLAHSQPDLTALLMAAQLGRDQLGVDVDEVKTQTVEHVRRLFGMRIGSNAETLTTTRKTRKKLTA